jgi:hypothetical protein
MYLYAHMNERAVRRKNSLMTRKTQLHLKTMPNVQDFTLQEARVRSFLSFMGLVDVTVLSNNCISTPYSYPVYQNLAIEMPANPGEHKIQEDPR